MTALDQKLMEPFLVSVTMECLFFLKIVKAAFVPYSLQVLDHFVLLIYPVEFHLLLCMRFSIQVEIKSL